MSYRVLNAGDGQFFPGCRLLLRVLLGADRKQGSLNLNSYFELVTKHFLCKCVSGKVTEKVMTQVLPREVYYTV